jgi:hypothetical protein
MPKYLGDVRCWVKSGKHLLALSFSGFDPQATFAQSKLRGAAVSCCSVVCYRSGRDQG